jgi:hypothetical protein
VPTKTEKIFQNTANLQLRGSTYDATHMDKFLGSGYGEKSLGTNVASTYQASLKRAAREQTHNTGSFKDPAMQSHGGPGDSIYEPGSIDDKDITMETSMMQHRTAHSRLPNYLVSSQAIKPTISFMSLGREAQKINHFVDLQDGPSSLQKRPGVPTARESMRQELPYETERNYHLQSKAQKMDQLEKARSTLFKQDGESSIQSLTTPSQKRQELATLKQQLTEYN